MAQLAGVDGIVYINLAHRTDRKKRLEAELKRLQVDPRQVERVEAHFDELNGHRGCVLSHIRALDVALAKPWNRILILEDDCTFLKSRRKIHSYLETFYTHFDSHWDVLLLGGWLQSYYKTPHPSFLRIDYCMRAHAYLIQRDYIPKLRANFLQTYESLQHDLFFVSSAGKALDNQWVELQRADRWFIGTASIAMQSRSYSDIGKRFKRLRP